MSTKDHYRNPRTQPRPKSPPRPTLSLDEQQLRDHVILDLDRLTPDEFMRRHATALRDLLISPIDSDADVLDTLLGPYRKDIMELGKVLDIAASALDGARIRIDHIGLDLGFTEAALDPSVLSICKRLVTVSERLNKAYEAAGDITLETEW